MSRFSIFRRNKQDDPESALPTASTTTGNRKKNSRPSDTDDPMLPEKKRARRRLVGAVTITLAAIIILPMIFDSEPKTVSQDLLIDIPSRDKPVTPLSTDSRKKPESKPSVKPLPGEPAQTEKKPELTEKKDNKPDVPAKDSKTVTARAAESGAGSATAAKPDAAKPDSSGKKEASAVSGDKKTDSKADARAEVKTDRKVEKSAGAKAVTPPKKDDDPISQLIEKNAAGTAGASKLIIQVAAVSSQDKANELQARLKKAGLNSYTQKVTLKEGGERIRVRIGPLSNKNEVNSTCAKLSQLSLSCTLVN